MQTQQDYIRLSGEHVDLQQKYSTLQHDYLDLLEKFNKDGPGSEAQEVSPPPDLA